MVELADTLDLGSSGAIHAGSSPVTRTTIKASLVYQGKRGFSCYFGIKRAKRANWGVRTAFQLLPNPIWFSAVKNHPIFRCALLDFDFTCNIKLLQTRRPRGMII